MNIEFRDVCEVMWKAYESMVASTMELPSLEVEWVYKRMMETFREEDLETLLEDDFGRGLVLGQLMCLYEMEEMQKVFDAEET